MLIKILVVVEIKKNVSGWMSDNLNLNSILATLDHFPGFNYPPSNHPYIIQTILT